MHGQRVAARGIDTHVCMGRTYPPGGIYIHYMYAWATQLPDSCTHACMGRVAAKSMGRMAARMRVGGRGASHGQRAARDRI